MRPIRDTAPPPAHPASGTATDGGESRARAQISASLTLPAEDSGPLYRRVTALLLREIEQGRLPPGALIPPEVELARRLGVSRHTMRAGIEALVREGRLERRRGHGTIVRQPPVQQSLARFYSVAGEMRRRGTALETRVLRRGRLTPGHALAAAACINLALDDPRAIGYLMRLRLMDGAPLLLEWITFPVALDEGLSREPVPGAPDRAVQPFYDSLNRAGVHVTRATEAIHAVACSRPDARLLACPTGAPLLRVERVGYAGDRPVEWRRALIRGDRYSFTAELTEPTGSGDFE
ncbi:MAG TPA: GntR family transcriptional regulator [Ktedonobacterales bacterium]|nr:GntR family transcriptional regulator [Ktedonobacterales bacterium]